MPEQATNDIEGPKIRLDGLTGMRWWAAFLVFLYHIHVFAPIPGPLTTLFAQGYRGVTFFFVLSGFVLTWSFSARVSKSTFYWRRFARIFPSHVVAWVIAVPVFYALVPGVGADWLKPADPGVLALSLVLLQGWWLAPTVLFAGNPAAWTLTCEAFFYAFHPFAQSTLRAVKRVSPLTIGTAVLVTALLVRAAAVAWPDSGFAHLPPPIRHAPEFIIGMCIAWALRTGWRPRLPVLLGVAAIGAVILAIAFAPAIAPGTFATKVITEFGNELFTVACAIAILSVASSTLRGRRSYFADRIQIRMGEYSYAFYLLHATVFYGVMHFIDPLPVSWFNILPTTLIFIVALMLASGLYHFVERPFERRMRKWKDDRDLAHTKQRNKSL